MIINSLRDYIRKCPHLDTFNNAIRVNVNQSSASQSITGYEWSASFSADQIVSEKANEY